MTIIRTPRPDRYAIVPMPAVENRNLSWKARGLLAYLLSRPDNWRTSSQHLAQIGPDGRDAVRTGLDELVQAGYLIRHRRQDAGGRWLTETCVYDCAQPVHKPSTEAGLSDVGKPGAVTTTEITTNDGLTSPVTTETDCPLCTGRGVTHYLDDVDRCSMCAGSGADPR